MKKIFFVLTLTFFILAGCGTDGKDGVDGTDGTDGKDGIDGIDGTNGTDGKDGADGEDGPKGVDGEDGTNGIDGKDGTGGAEGADGADGTDGEDGADGEDGEKGEDGKIPFGFDLIKPENNKTFATTSFVSYTLAEDVQEITFIRTKVSGTGPEMDSVMLTGDYALAGYHESVEIVGAELTEGDVYNLTIEALDLDSDIVELTPVFNLTVDNTGPELLKAEAYQSVFGMWNEGDRLVFQFNEPMDISKLSTINDVRANLLDFNAAGDDFSGGLLVWSTDQKILSITCNSEDVSGTAFTAGSDDCSYCSEFNPSSDVRDSAGNSDATTTDINLISTGDVSTPRINITYPVEGRSIPIEPIIIYELSEELSEGKLAITLLGGGETDETPLREITLDAARRTKGLKTISLSDGPLPALVEGAYYSIEIEGKDGAGNVTSHKISEVIADNTAPEAPHPAKIFTRNYSGELVIKAGETVGIPGDYLRLYIDGILTAETTFPGTYGKTEDHVIISGLDLIPERAAITYTLIDEAGNESELVSDGTMPAKPNSNDISKLGVRASTTDYAVGSTGNITANSNLYINLDMNTENTVFVGWTDGIGNFIPSSNTIPSELISYETEVYYVYLDSGSGHFSDYSEKDGEFVRVESIAIIDNNFNGNISPNDEIEISCSGDVDIFTSFNSFSYGQALSLAGNYQWAAALSDFNVAPVSVGAASTFSGPGFINQNPLFGSSKFYIEMNFANFTVGNIDQVRLEVHPLGTNEVLSYNGGHCLLPSTQITPDGTTGGLISPDF